MNTEEKDIELKLEKLYEKVYSHTDKLIDDARKYSVKASWWLVAVLIIWAIGLFVHGWWSILVFICIVVAITRFEKYDHKFISAIGKAEGITFFLQKIREVYDK